MGNRKELVRMSGPEYIKEVWTHEKSEQEKFNQKYIERRDKWGPN